MLAPGSSGLSATETVIFEVAEHMRIVTFRLAVAAALQGIADKVLEADLARSRSISTNRACRAAIFNGKLAEGGRH